MPAPIGNAPLLPLHESKSAMLPRSSFLLSYTPLDCSISPGIISGTSVIIFQNCSLRPCYKKKKKILFPLSSRRQLLSCATFSTFAAEFTTWVSCPARRTWKEELERARTELIQPHTTTHSVNTYEKADCRESFCSWGEKGAQLISDEPF